mmetsp:Transcript_3699/g.9499  ORF Transcript_3699/g.9499 Transcript_3699/m.9499 type:complete len:408 (-) Transcript_3699:376-1599(-)
MPSALRARMCVPSDDQAGGDGPTTGPSPSRVSIVSRQSSDVVQTTPSSAWLSRQRPSGEIRRPTIPRPRCTGTGTGKASLVLGSHAATPPSWWPMAITPRPLCTAAAVTLVLAGNDRRVCPFSKSQSFTVWSMLAVKACASFAKKPQPVRVPKWPRSTCKSFCARRSKSRKAWSAEPASNSPPLVVDKSTSESFGRSRETEICACGRAVSPSKSFTKPSAVPMATNCLGKGAPCEPAAAMQVSSALWILRNTHCCAGMTGASTANRLGPKASDSRSHLVSDNKRSASAARVWSCSCFLSSCAFSSAFSRPRSVACLLSCVCACSFSRSSSSRSWMTWRNASISCSFARKLCWSFLLIAALVAACSPSSSTRAWDPSAGVAEAVGPAPQGDSGLRSAHNPRRPSRYCA